MDGATGEFFRSHDHRRNLNDNHDVHDHNHHHHDNDSRDDDTAYHAPVDDHLPQHFTDGSTGYYTDKRPRAVTRT